MWKECEEIERACRTAVNGSIYMRKASLQLKKSNDNMLKNTPHRQRNPSFGKIVKNRNPLYESTSTNLQQSLNSKLIFPNTHAFTKPLPEQSSLFKSDPFRTPIRKSNHFQEQEECIKIRSIEEKYRSMLSNYEAKKKQIDDELQQLKKSQIRQKQFPSQNNFNTGSRRHFSTFSGRIEEKQKQNTYSMKADYPHINITNQRAIEAKGKEIISPAVNSKTKLLVQQQHELVKMLRKNQENKQKITNKFPLFFKAFSQQMGLQEKLRNLKSKIFSREGLKDKIKSIVEEKGESGFEIDEEEVDPFLNLNEQLQLSPEQLAQKLIELNKQSSQHWKNQVAKLSPREAREIFSGLNFEKTQQISLKSFVRELSFLLGRHLRNRDLIKIYRRISPLTEPNFVSALIERS